MKPKKIIFVLAIAVLIVGCQKTSTGQEDQNYACTASLEPGIVVEIRDAFTDEPLAANAIVVITDNDYRETLVVTGYDGYDYSTASTVSGAYERPGIYDIEVSLTGYANWYRYGVEVTGGGCHVGTVKFTARLEKI